VDLLIFGAAAAVLAAVVAYLAFGPSAESWVTGEPERVERVVQIYTTNRQAAALARAGDRHEHKLFAAELLEIRTGTMREWNIADDDQPVVRLRLRVVAQRWKNRALVAAGGELLPGADFSFYGPGYKIFGWVLKVE
jgi:hypothetical protein